MNSTMQITIYATSLGAILALMRVLAGLTESRAIKNSLLLTSVYSGVALMGSLLAKGLMTFPTITSLYAAQPIPFNSIATAWFFLWFFAVLYCFGMGVLLRLYVRAVRFKDWGTFGNTRAIPPRTWYRQYIRQKERDRKDYETHSIEHGDLALKVFESYIGDSVKMKSSYIITGNDPWPIRNRLASMCYDLIAASEGEINYVTCTVSPYELWKVFQEMLNEDRLALLKKRLVFVDAYTSTFGFSDEILNEHLREMQVHDHVKIVSCDSTASIHSGTSKAFKLLKEEAIKDKSHRRPCTMIYDTLSALCLSETEDEVSEFVIHLTAAEHAYGMMTFFFEPEARERSSKVLDTMRSCCGHSHELLNPHELLNHENS